MEGLPTEVLVNILSRVGDGLALLEIIPLVCRRWLNLSRDPQCWTNVRVVANRDWKSQRLLACARGLQSLKFDFVADDRERLRRALCCSRAVVSELAVSEAAWKSLGEDNFHRLLRRSARRLRVLRTFLDEQSDMLDTIARMPRLEELRLELTEQFDGELETQFAPRLRVLQVRSCSNDDAFPAKLVLGLLRECAGTLEVADFGGCWKITSDVVRRLSDCPRLRRLVAHTSCLDVPSAVENVVDLTLDVHFDNPVTMAHDVCESVMQALRLCRELKYLTSLSFRFFLFDRLDFDAICLMCDVDVMEFSRLRPDVECELVLWESQDQCNVEEDLFLEPDMC